MYAKGEGVLKDMRRAKELLGQVYEKGDSEMKAASKKYQMNMSYGSTEMLGEKFN